MSSEPFDSLAAIPLNEVPAHIPGRPSMATVWRWVLSGVRGPDGGKIKLRSYRVAGRRFVHPDAIRDFIRAWNNADDVPAEPAVDHQRVNRALEKLGC